MNKLADKMIETLRGNPVALVLVVVNVVFLSYVVREVAATGARRDALIAELARDCATDRAPKGDRK